MSGVTTYRPCEKRCGTCDQCKAFAKVVGEIDLAKVSASDLHRQAESLLRKGER